MLKNTGLKCCFFFFSLFATTAWPEVKMGDSKMDNEVGLFFLKFNANAETVKEQQFFNLDKTNYGLVVRNILNKGRNEHNLNADSQKEKKTDRNGLTFNYSVIERSNKKNIQHATKVSQHNEEAKMNDQYSTLQIQGALKKTKRKHKHVLKSKKNKKNKKNKKKRHQNETTSIKS